MKWEVIARNEVPKTLGKSNYDEFIDTVVEYGVGDNALKVDTEMDPETIKKFVDGIRARGYARGLKFNLKTDGSILYASVKE